MIKNSKYRLSVYPRKSTGSLLLITKEKIYMKTALLIMTLLGSGHLYAVTSSDVIKYGLTAHGIKYLLRDKKGSVNAWKSNENVSNIPAPGSSVPMKRWGNTDCSGLVSAALRIGGYHAPEKKGKPALSTAGLGQNAAKGRSGLYIVATGSKMSSKVVHGDILNRTGKPYGHVFIYNGEDSRNLINSVEARCTKCGVGAFVKSWNDVYKTNYKLIRSKNVRNDIGNKRTVISRSQATAKSLGNKSLLNEMRSETVVIKAGDNIELIAMDFGVSIQDLREMNPEVNFDRLKVGQTINVNFSSDTSI